jgi:hypothetical protein
MLAIPATLPPRHFSCDIPGAKETTALALSTSSVFADSTLLLHLADPDGSLTTAFLMVPDFIATVCVLASDQHRGYYYADASVLMQEVEADRARVSLLLATQKENVTRIPVEPTR